VCQDLGRDIPESVHASFCFLEVLNSSERCDCDRASILHGELRFPPCGMLLRFEVVPQTKIKTCPHAENVRIEG
jgi:hypothetical protein